ncbi:MAG: ankyrin repeat domain-containing protein [Parashewanella sp.]
MLAAITGCSLQKVVAECQKRDISPILMVEPESFMLTIDGRSYNVSQCDNSKNKVRVEWIKAEKSTAKPSLWQRFKYAVTAHVIRKQLEKYFGLSQAAKMGDCSRIKALLNAGVDVDTPCTALRANTPLQIAALNGQLKCVRLLISKSADVSKHNEDGYTPLKLAARAGRNAATCSSILLNHLADPYQKAWLTNIDAFCSAAQFADRKTVKVYCDYLKSHADRYTQEQVYEVVNSMIKSAVVRNRVEMLNLLRRERVLELVVSNEQRSKLLTSAVASAIEVDAIACLTILKKMTNIAEVRFENGITPVMLAAKMGRPTVMKFLMSQRLNVYDCCSEGKTAADYAKEQIDELKQKMTDKTCLEVKALTARLHYYQRCLELLDKAHDPKPSAENEVKPLPYKSINALGKEVLPSAVFV